MRRSATLAVIAGLVGLFSTTAALGVETVTFESEDGFALTGDLWRAEASDAPVALLLHQFNADRHSFQDLQPALTAAGFTVLSLDQRGQGASTLRRASGVAQTVRIRALPKERVGPLVASGPKDVAAALAFLAGQGLSVDRVVLVGSSYGCTVSLLAAAEGHRVRGVALLSPGADYFGVDALDAARSYSGPLFAVAAEDDPVRSSPPGTRAIGQAHEGPEEIRILPKGGHGVSLLTAHPKLAGEIAEFLATAAGLRSDSRSRGGRRRGPRRSRCSGRSRWPSSSPPRPSGRRSATARRASPAS